MVLALHPAYGAQQLLRGIPGVVVYIDDILVTEPTESDNLHALGEDLKRLGDAGLRAKKLNVILCSHR